MTVPATVPAGKQGIARVEAEAGVKSCAVTARRGKTTEGPFRVAVKTTDATVGWQVPATARRGRWTLSVRCGKAKARSASVTVQRKAKGGKPTLIKRGSLRVVRGGTATPVQSCAAAWNGYASRLDDGGYCSGYDTAYVASRLGEAFKGLGHAADWPKNAKARGLWVSNVVAGISGVAWWKAKDGRPARVAYLERIDAAPALVVTEMNARRWNQATTRKIAFDFAELPDGYIYPLLEQGAPPAQPVVEPPPGPLPTVVGSLTRGAGRTAEIVASTYQPIGGRTSFLSLGFGTGNVFAASHLGDLGLSNSGVATSGDVNGDGRDDLIALNPTGYGVALSHGDGSFTAVRSAATFGRVWGVYAMDTNRDGRADIVTLEEDFQYAVALSNGDGTFTRGPVRSTGALQRGSVGDFTGDGIPDLHSMGTLLRGNGDGTFTERSATGGNELWHVAEAGGDVNGDGKADLVMAVSPGNGHEPGYFVSLSNGDGTFAAAVKFADWQPESYSLTTGDVDGDGRLDIVTRENSGKEITAYLGHGDGTFTRTVLATTSINTGTSLTLADIDGR